MNIKAFRLLHSSSWGWGILGLLASWLYWGQNLFMPPSILDEAQQADYLHSIWQGQLPYRDFLDIYGPTNWLLPALAYGWAGERWIGVRIYLIFLHGLTTWLTYGLVHSFVGRFYAFLAAGLTVILLGMPWAFHYGAYAFVQLYPVILATAWLLCRSQLSKTRLLVAGGLTGFAIFTKITTGFFLLAAGLFLCFFLRPVRTSPSALPVSHTPLQWGFLGGQFFGLLSYGMAFSVILFRYYEKQYFWHLTFPLLGLLGASGYQLWREFQSLPLSIYWAQARERFQHWALLLASSLGMVGLGLLVFYPLGVTLPFLQGLLAILQLSDYYEPFAPLGAVSFHNQTLTSLIQTHWPELPWGVTSLWLVGIGGVYWWRNGRYDRATSLSPRLWRLLSLGWIVTLGHFIIYPVPDLGHLLQDFVLWLVAFAVGLGCLERFLCRSQKKRWAWRAFWGFVLCLWAGPLVQWPQIARYQPRGEAVPGIATQVDWLHLWPENPADRPYHQALIEVSQYLAARTQPREEVWVLSKDILVHFYSGTSPYGGAHRFLLYLAMHGRMPRVSLNQLIPPPGFWLTAPPRYLVESSRHPAHGLREAIPELNELLARRFQVVFRNALFVIYERQHEK